MGVVVVAIGGSCAIDTIKVISNGVLPYQRHLCAIINVVIVAAFSVGIVIDRRLIALLTAV